MKEAQERCNSLYLQGKRKNQINQKLKEKLEEKKLESEMSQCTFHPIINSSIKLKGRAASMIFLRENRAKQTTSNNEFNDLNSTLYDKYKNKVTNMIAFRNKEVYIKKKVEGQKIQKFFSKRLDINIVLDNNKTVLNDKLTKNFVKRYEKARGDSLKTTNKTENKKSKHLTKSRSLTMRCFFNNQASINSESMSSLKSPSLKYLKDSLRRELSQVEL